MSDAAAYMTSSKQRTTPYARPMDYPSAYHPRMSGLYPRTNMGYGYEARWDRISGGMK